MADFDFSFEVYAPLDAVVSFHNDTRALKLLSPPPMFVQLQRVEPLAEGSVSAFTLWLGPSPMRWRAVHSQVSLHGFTDTMEYGPLARWCHTHSFVPLNHNTTRIEEHIEYAHTPGLGGLLSRLIFSKPGLWALFTYRKWATRRALQKRRNHDE